MFEHSVYNNQKEKLSVHQQINNSKVCLIYIHTVEYYSTFNIIIIKYY